MSTNAQLTQQINDLLAAWNTREAQFRAWLAGTPTGGPNSDGRYPLSDAGGNTQLVDCPAKLASSVEGPAGVSVAAQLLSQSARDTAIAARDRAVTAETAAIAMNAQTLSYRNLAQTYRDEAAAFAAGLSSAQAAAVAAKTAAEVAQGLATQKATDAASSEANAAASAVAAAASAAAAATFDPSSYYTKTAADARYKPIAYVPSWSEITGKPSTFTPSAHSHVIGDVTGLQAALDGKQPVGSYLTGITSGQVTTALGYTPYNSTNPSGYISGITSGMVTTALGFTPANKGGDTFTGQVAFSGGITSGVVFNAEGGSEGGELRLAKAPTGSTLGGNVVFDTQANFIRFFEAGGTFRGANLDLGALAGGAGSRILTDTTLTSGNVTTALGFTPYNASNPSGYISGITSGMVTSALGFTPYNASNPSGYISGITSGMVTGALGYTPVQQGGGTGQGANKVYVGWLGSQLGLQVDSTNFGGTWPIHISGTAAVASSISGSTFSASGDFRAPLFYDSDNTAYFLNLAGTSRLSSALIGAEEAFVYSEAPSKLVVRTGPSGSYKYFRFDSNGGFYALSGDLNASGNAYIEGDLFVGIGKNVSRIYMLDSDEGTREIHCNSNRIGFLTQGGGWGAWCEDDGTWATDTACNAPIFYDRNDTGYYLNPNGTSSLNEVVTAGLLTGRSCAGTDVNTANDTGSFSVRGSSTTVAAMSFHRTGTYAMNMGLGTDNVFRIGGWSASSNAFQMDGSGNLTMLGNVTAYSDARLKKDVETISGALDIVQQLRGVRYTRIDSGERQVGVIAQETLKVVPEVVQQGIGDDDTLSVAYGNLVGILIEAIKELRAEVADLKGSNK
jgi:hypothetical protein